MQFDANPEKGSDLQHLQDAVGVASQRSEKSSHIFLGSDRVLVAALALKRAFRFGPARNVTTRRPTFE